MMVSLMQRILVVDDEEQYRELMQEVLLRAGYACEVVEDAFEALKKLEQDRFDLVISDIRMKGMDGLHLAQEARKRRPQLDFIIMTGHAAEYSYSDIINAGATDFITKPFVIHELKAKIERIERERQVIQSLYETNEALSQESALNGSLAELSKALIASLTFESISSLVLQHARELTHSALGYVGYILPGTGHLICSTMTAEVWDECTVAGKSHVFYMPA
jgi:DNA-binding NtrC family response regulator